MVVEGDDIIHLNVGGSLYTTAKNTLAKQPDSMLGRMVLGDISTATDDRGNIFVDRDGPMFRHILNFLRSGKLLLPDDFREFALLEAEADFYQLSVLVECIRASLDEQKRRQEAEATRKATVTTSEEMEKSSASEKELGCYIDLIESNHPNGTFLTVVAPIDLLFTFPLRPDDRRQLEDLIGSAPSSRSGAATLLDEGYAELRRLAWPSRVMVGEHLRKCGSHLRHSSVSCHTDSDGYSETVLIGDKWFISELALTRVRMTAQSQRALPPGQLVGFIDWMPNGV